MGKGFMSFAIARGRWFSSRFLYTVIVRERPQRDLIAL